mmetsp:Transcript_19895/g.45857  ORF Transcript_19895/g.45857 Transcript_19895/m.45857 type:complete len:298 (+) Transcript_19895:1572-2465(+)
MKSEPETERKGTFASPAVALASSVLPVPGGPTSIAPLGIFAPSSRYLPGFLRKSTSSMTSTLASARPATSAKVMPVFCSFVMTCGLALPTWKMLLRPPPLPPPPPSEPIPPRIMKAQKPISSSVGAILSNSFDQLVSVSYVTGIWSRGATPSSSCAASSRFSNAPTLPSEISYCGSNADVPDARRDAFARFLFTITMRSTSPVSSTFLRNSDHVISLLSPRPGIDWYASHAPVANPSINAVGSCIPFGPFRGSPEPPSPSPPPPEVRLFPSAPLPLPLAPLPEPMPSPERPCFPSAC